MIVPASCLKYIELQRTNYINIADDYKIDMISEFNRLLNVIPSVCKSIFDIGCGIGGIDVFLSKYYDSPALYLFDKNKIDDKIEYGYKKTGSFYNSFDELKNMMDSNNIEHYKIMDVNKGFPKIENIELIISLLACGFHFPVDMYIKDIYNAITKNGTLILDIRKGEENQIETIKKYFKNVFEIETFHPKTIRICAKEIVVIWQE